MRSSMVEPIRRPSPILQHLAGVVDETSRRPSRLHPDFGPRLPDGKQEDLSQPFHDVQVRLCQWTAARTGPGERFDGRPRPPAMRWRPCHRRASIPTTIANAANLKPRGDGMVCDFGVGRGWKRAMLFQTFPTVDPGSGMELGPHHDVSQPARVSFSGSTPQPFGQRPKLRLFRASTGLN